MCSKISRLDRAKVDSLPGDAITMFYASNSADHIPRHFALSCVAEAVAKHWKSWPQPVKDELKGILLRIWEREFMQILLSNL